MRNQRIFSALAAVILSYLLPLTSYLLPLTPYFFSQR